MNESCEILILGGGCAGLSLVKALADQSYKKRIIIIEPRQSYQHDRTWCFWEKEIHSLSSIVSKKWDRWRVSKSNQEIEHKGSKLSYQQIRSEDFYRARLETIEDCSNIELRQGQEATVVCDMGDKVVVETGTTHITANYVVDTRPRPLEENTALLWQIFSGAEVETSEASFDPSKACLMKHMTSDANGLKFVYVLPVSDYKALVQTTRFSLKKIAPQQLDQEFKSDLATLVNGRVTLQRRERGCLPMGQMPLPVAKSCRIVRAGQAAGALRPSSGYGFLRIQSWANALAKDFAEGKQPIAVPLGSSFERFMDAIFINALLRFPHASSNWFVKLADKLSGDEFGQFMTVPVKLGLWLKVVMALPKSPFITAIMIGAPKHDHAKNTVKI